MGNKIQNTECSICGGAVYIEVDDRRYYEVGSPRRSRTLKCLGCGCSMQNCNCPNISEINQYL